MNLNTNSTRQSKTTMYDLARELGLSRTTVSYALSSEWEKFRIPASTRQRVLALAQEKNYRRNRVAVSLRTRQTKTIGVLVPPLGHEQHEFLTGVDEALGEDYTTLLGSSRYTESREIKILQSFEERMVDGLIVISSGSDATRDLLKEITTRGVPIVQSDHYYSDIPSAVVEADQKSLTRVAVQHLFDMGHSNIVYIRPPRLHSGSEDRIEGYREVIERHGLEARVYPRKPKVLAGDAPSYFAEQVKRVLAAEKPPFAIFSHGYLSVLRTILEAEVRCPDDVSIITASSSSRDIYSGLLKVEPTSVNWSILEMGRQSGALLKKALQGESSSVWRQHIKLPVNLVAGESVARLA